MKNEMRHYRAFTHLSAAHTAVMEHIEPWYNRRRTHRTHRSNDGSARWPRVSATVLPRFRASRPKLLKGNQTNCLKSLTSSY
ncbi:hypothetical protein FQ154_12545 [Paeniglutamicibacter gangotriensis]|uniref:Uncharacterized protein n=1 Tax=Paeniglutamicibacter gangotriensis TaxID=254787 RepID=A0A5B0ECD7_9MICC|nr:hypothetical protein FQ154_12545 [Paeniglutamicibacter gangotriensis]